jgi:small-conductance mechanosensitive channel
MTSIRKISSIVTLGAAAAFLVAGPYMVYRGVDARNMVRAELRAEKIVTPDDSSDPGIRVQDAHSAIVQADIIKHHALTATNGKTFSEMERTDPARTTAFQASALRTSLLSSALAWNVANLVIGLGALVFVLGGVLLAVGLVTRKPEQVLLATAPDHLREPVTS